MSAAQEADGKIVVAGYARIGSFDDFAVARFNADGSLSLGFNGTGKLTTAFGTGHDQASSVALQGDGEIVVTGFGTVNSHNELAVARYLIQVDLPVVVTGGAVAINKAGATIMGTVDPGGGNGTAFFQYGTDVELWQRYCGAERQWRCRRWGAGDIVLASSRRHSITIDWLAPTK